MRRLVFTLVPLLLACERQPVAPDVSPSFDFANAPDFTGIVVRGEAVGGASWPDPEKNLRITIGFDPVELCADPMAFDLLIFASKNLPIDRTNMLLELNDARIAVWPFSGNSCASYRTVAPLATGYGDLVATNNDYPFGSANANTHTRGLSAHGTLAWTADGSPAQVSGHLRVVWDKTSPPRIIDRQIILR